MKRFISIIIISLLILTGCTSEKVTDLADEDVSPIIAVKATQVKVEESANGSQEVITTDDTAIQLEKKMTEIDFENISGYYTRKASQEDGDYIEMFAFDKSTFVRITTNDLDREVFAYNYKSDDFTYIYYFDGEMTAKTVLNVGTGAVLEDDGEYAELLAKSADELKGYFKDLLEVAGLAPDELHY